MITVKQVLAFDPCHNKNYLKKIYPMSLNDCAFKGVINGVMRHVEDRIWIMLRLATPEQISNSLPEEDEYPNRKTWIRRMHRYADDPYYLSWHYTRCFECSEQALHALYRSLNDV